ncbi:SYM1 [Sanghuangporus weigelae]
MASVLRAYNALLQRRPMATQCITGAVLFGAGDVIAQQAIEKHPGRKYDFARTARLAFYGGALFGPIMTKWYQLLNRLQFASPTKALVYRVWLDQAVLTPAAVGFFFTSMTFLEGKGISEAKRRVEAAYIPTILRNWGVFVPTQVINFSVVPAHMRFVFVGVVSLFWNTYLSYANAQQAKAALLAKSGAAAAAAPLAPISTEKVIDLEKGEAVKSVAPT